MDAGGYMGGENSTQTWTLAVAQALTLAFKLTLSPQP